jgi:allophanate hydrolase subunit 2
VAGRLTAEGLVDNRQPVTAVPEHLKRRVLTLLRQGLISVTGAAYVCDVSKQAVSKWCADARIDPRQAEMARWAKIKRQASGSPRRP